MMKYPDLPLPAGPFATVVIDPPWPIGDRPYDRQRKLNPAPYDTMSLATIFAMPIRAMLAPDAFCCIWATDHCLPAAVNLLAEWGCGYQHTLVWVKVSAAGKPVGYQRPNAPKGVAEYLVIGARGKPAFADTTDFPTVLTARRGVCRRGAGLPAVGVIGVKLLENCSKFPCKSALHCIALVLSYA